MSFLPPDLLSLPLAVRLRLSRQPPALPLLLPRLKDPETDRLARQVANLTGETLTEVVRTSLRERLRHETLKRGESPDVAKALAEIA
jgi:hypothetical protein